MHVATGSYTAYLRTDPAIIPLLPHRTYRITFRYRILTPPTRGFEVLFYSPTAGAAGHYLPSVTVTGTAGDTGSATLTNTLGPHGDHQARWNVVGTGAIAIDEIRIVSVATGQTVAAEDGEPAAPGAGIYDVPNPRFAYRLDLAASGTDVIDRSSGVRTLVPFGQRVSSGYPSGIRRLM